MDSDALLRGYQIHAMESNVPKALLGYLILVVIFAYLLHSEWRTLFAIWGPIVMVVCIARSYFAWTTARRPITPTPLSTERRLMVMTAVVATTMAIGPAWIGLHSDGYTRAFMLMLIVSTMWGGALVQATVFSSAVAFTGANIPIWIVAILVSGATFDKLGLAGMFFVTIVVAMDNTRRYARYFEQSIKRQIALEEWDEQARVLRMIDDMPVAVMTVDPNTFTITYANEPSKRLIKQIEHLLTIKADNLVGTSIDAFHRHPEHQRRLLSDPANLPHNARIKLGPEVLDLKVSAVTASDGTYIGPMLTWALVTKEVETENRIQRLARYDTLTALPNRMTFHEELERRLATPGNRAGLLYIDLDGFKLVNDTRGHGVGDVLLKEVAARLGTVCNAPAVTVGRLGGDEFAVVLPHDDVAKAEAMAHRIIEAVSAPYDLAHGNIRIGASVGIAVAPEHGKTGETLLTRADIALYAAKATGKGRSRIFGVEMESRVHERVRLENKLRVALKDREGLFVFYQPIVSIETGKVTAREALVRWHHSSRGWISPAEFVPVAEQSGLIDPLGEFVLDTACRDAAGWKDGARVAVNVSAAQLGKGVLAKGVLAALVASGLPADRLEIEVTETALLDEERDVLGELRRIRGLGVRVALDDFGTGFSSLSHLRAFPFDKIKIDGSFVKDSVDRPDCAAVVRAVADLGKRLRVTTVAEGVETQAQLNRIREEGCTEVQGYLFGRPAPSDHDAPLVDYINLDVPRLSAA